MTGNKSAEQSKFLEFPFYPLLYAVFVPVNLLAQNITLFAPSQGIRAALAFGFAAALALLLVRAVIRRSHAAALLTALLFVGIWIYQFSMGWRLAYVGVFLLVLALLWRGWNSARFTAGANLVMLVIILQPLYMLITDDGGEESANLFAPSPFDTIEISGGDAPLPNIVHIVLDGYANSTALSEAMGFDNSAFESQLQSLGFVVAQNARTPYNQTLMVMSSIYSGNFHALDQPPFLAGDIDDIKQSLGRVVAGGPVKRSLAQLGYKFLYTDPGFNFWQFGGEDIVSSPPLGPLTLSVYEQLLVERTSLNLIPRLYNLIVGRPSFLGARLSEITRNSLTTDFYSRYAPPYLLYEHVVAPHPPFTIDRNGLDTTRWSRFSGMADGGHATFGVPERQRRYIEGYLEKLRYVNNAVLKQVEQMLREVPAPKVIIIHGDHGGGAYYLPGDPKNSCLSERYSPLLAMYSDVPDIQEAIAPLATRRVNLANLFRIIFDARFGTQMGALPDRSWFADWETLDAATELSDAQIRAVCDLPAIDAS